MDWELCQHCRRPTSNPPHCVFCVARFSDRRDYGRDGWTWIWGTLDGEPVA